MNIPELYSLFSEHPQITTDSRNCPPGSLFFALRGEHFDGNLFARKALDAGADYAVVDRTDGGRDGRIIPVDDVLNTLQRLAQHHRTVLGIPVIGITGTNGKTTTKELLAAVLSARFGTLCTEGNLNNQIGLPLTLLRLTREHEMAVIEMGASHPGDIAELTEIARPDFGIITNVGRAHLEGFGSFDNVVKTKGELYDYIRRARGVVFIKKEDACLQAMAGGIRQVTYGSDDASYLSGRPVASRSPFLAFEWAQQGGAVHRVETSLIGTYNIDNVLAAVAAGCYFNIPAERICDAIASYRPSNHRSQLMQTEHNSLLLDAYNANPDSMKAALRNFAGMDAAPKAVILGDMKELGSGSPALHREILQEVQAGSFDRVILCGEQFALAAGQAYTVCLSTEELTDFLRTHPLRGYHILIKGSRGMALERCVGLL
jgi:UDP-N-acetylmuramoyl-tripeptide--D-alanyl-D-alanine ligase